MDNLKGALARLTLKRLGQTQRQIAMPQAELLRRKRIAQRFNAFREPQNRTPSRFGRR